MGRVALLGGFYRGDFFTVANEWEDGLVRGGCPPAICPPSLGFYSTGRVRWGGAGQARGELYFFLLQGRREVGGGAHGGAIRSRGRCPLPFVAGRLLLGSGSEPSGLVLGCTGCWVHVHARVSRMMPPVLSTGRDPPTDDASCVGRRAAPPSPTTSPSLLC